MNRKQTRLGLVVIGRNEAEHLRNSLPSISDHFNKVVYVDSGSTDASQEVANRFGAKVVVLDASIPFTAARARNAGYSALLEDGQKYNFVQFVDGDCQLLPEFVGKAVRFFAEHPEAGMVCGKRVERYPQKTIYNRLCDIEWDTPVGEAKYCGGDVMVRALAFKEVAGYDDGLIAGEDPEVCVRMRQAGWKIYRIDADMTLHDANMRRFSQWWKRNARAGYAFAEGVALHGEPPERHWVHETKSNFAWGMFFLVALAGGVLIHPLLFILLLVFPLQGIRLAFTDIWNTRKRPFSQKLLYGLNCYFAKLPQFSGQMRFLFNRLTRRKQTIIEYKQPTAQAGSNKYRGG